MNIKQDQERVRDLIKDTLTLLCKNGLHFNRNFLIEGLIGITLDDDQIFLINIKEQFISNACKTVTKETSTSVKHKFALDKKNKISEDAVGYVNIQDDKEEINNEIKIEHLSDVEEDSPVSSFHNKSQKTCGKSILSYKSRENISRNKCKEPNTFMDNSQFFQPESQTTDNDNFMLDSFSSSTTNTTQSVVNLPKSTQNMDFEMESFIEESVDEKNVIQIKDEDDDTDNEESSYQMYDEGSGPSFESFHNPQNSFEAIPPSNQKFANVRKNCGEICCPRCGIFVKTSTILMKHIKFTHEKQYELCCPICKHGVRTNEELGSHMSAKHGYSKEFKCEICLKEFARKSILIRHLKENHLK